MTGKLLRTSSAQADLALLILRLVVGAIFIAHGAQKLFVFGLEGLQGAFGQMGIPAAGVVAPLVAVGELAGGFALMAGVLTRLVGVALALIMLGAILIVHLSAGFFAPEGIEFPLVLLGGALALAVGGAGAWSVDAVLAQRSTTA